MNILAYIKIAAGIAILALIAYSYKLAYDKGYDSATTELNQKTEAANLRANEISAKFEARLSEMKIVNTTVNKQVTHEIEKQIYSDCKVPQAGIDLLNLAVSGLPSQPSPTNSTR